MRGKTRLLREHGPYVPDRGDHRGGVNEILFVDGIYSRRSIVQELGTQKETPIKRDCPSDRAEFLGKFASGWVSITQPGSSFAGRFGSPH